MSGEGSMTNIHRGVDAQGVPWTFSPVPGQEAVRVSHGQQVFGYTAEGERVHVADSIPASCGAVFDEYVKRVVVEPFPYDAKRPASQTIHELWKGRKLRFLTIPKGRWKQGQIVSWCQWNTGPYCSCTFWNMVIKMDNPPQEKFHPGDLVIIKGLANAKQHNGQEATIKKFVPDQGRFLVTYRLNGTSQNVGVKPTNLGKWQTKLSDLSIGSISMEAEHWKKPLPTRLNCFCLNGLIHQYLLLTLIKRACLVPCVEPSNHIKQDLLTNGMKH